MRRRNHRKLVAEYRRILVENAGLRSRLNVAERGLVAWASQTDEALARDIQRLLHMEWDARDFEEPGRCRHIPSPVEELPDGRTVFECVDCGATPLNGLGEEMTL